MVCYTIISLAYSDYKGWTCLHHAASAGYTKTMEILLSANPKLLDKTDEDGVMNSKVQHHANLTFVVHWCVEKLMHQ